MNSNAPSPVTGRDSEIIAQLNVKKILDGYLSEINIDVAPYYQGMNSLPIYKCPDTGLRFFSPSTLAGDGDFYKHLEKDDNYYTPWKWDYEIAWPYIKEKDTVLDIGCGSGTFLKKLKEEKDCTVHGLELNPSAFKHLQQTGISSQMQTIEEHATVNKNKYDVVCFFQVLEHIPSVKSFLNAAIECLKPGGLMIVAVPNNDPFLFGYFKYEWLNLPPHHVGWWNAESLNALSNHFPLEVVKIKAAPFRDYNYYLRLKERHLSIEAPGRLPIFKATRLFQKIWIQVIKNNFPGNYISAIYKKMS